GMMPGRYMDQQIAFYGIENVAAARKDLAVVRTDFRVRLMKNNYLTAILNAATSSDSLLNYANAWEKVGNVYGAALQYTYNSVLGPIRGDLHWSSYSKKVGAFLSIGFDF
ncbi:MAG: phospholipase, partial [Bacteroidales bacterium]|nr:phospholipase [Candidatus Cryptobacteroides faecihippi]